MAAEPQFNIQMAQRIELWPLDRLRPYERNARTHSAEQVAQIAASITEFGFTNPILVDSSDGIVAGHGRLEAARHLGLSTIPVVVLDHLSERQRRAYIIADNKLALNAGWDVELLAFELSELESSDFDFDAIGFSDSEVAALTASFASEAEEASLDAMEEWKDMPEFEHEDKTSFRRIVVHFKTNEDVEEFGRLIGQHMTEKTRSIWFPPDEIGRIADKRYG